MRNLKILLGTFNVVLGCLACVQAQSFLTNGLVAYYPLNGNVNDASGNGYHGVLANGSFAVDQFGRSDFAVFLNNTNNSAPESFAGRINVPPTTVNNLSLGTISAFIKPIQTSSGAIWGKNHAGQNSYSFTFGVNTSAGGGINPGQQGILYFHSRNNNPNAQSSAAIQPNVWQLVTVTFSSSVCTFYINGQPVGSSVGNYSIPNDPSADASSLGAWLGLEPINPVAQYARLYGSIDEVRIYNRPLSAAEVEQLYDFSALCTPHRATATATLVNGFVVGASIVDGGCGYTNPPPVMIQGGGGSGAMAMAEILDGRVTQINITNAGCCYTSLPTIVIGSPPFVATLEINVSKVKVKQNVVLGYKYVLESSFNLLDWVATGPAFTAESETIVDEFDVDVTGRFFRLRVVP